MYFEPGITESRDFLAQKFNRRTKVEPITNIFYEAR